MIIVIFILNLAFAGETLSLSDEPVFSAEEYRCKFVSAKNQTVTHQFKWYSWETDRRCEYGIKVNNETILVSTAFTDECQSFLHEQQSKGSLCLVNNF